MLRNYIVILFLFPLTTYAQQDSIPSYYAKGMEAYDSGNFESFLSYFQELNKIRPNHPTIIYNLSAAYALNNQPAGALKFLDILFRMDAGLWSNAQQDQDFENLHGMEGWHAMGSKVASYQKVISQSKVGQVLSARDHIESVEKVEDHLFFGSVNSRSIFRLDEELEVWLNFEEVPEMFAVMGLAYDQQKGHLWVCTAALPQMNGYDESLEGYSSVLAFDVESGDIVTSIVIEDATFGDLIMAEEGVFISDSRGNRIYRASAGSDTISMLVDLSAVAFNLQGLTRSGNQLFVSDYIQGIYRIDLTTGRHELVSSKSPVSLKGIDGLYFLNNRLVGLQNGTKPNRVLELALSGSGIDNVRVLDQNRPEFGEPTQGYIFKDALIYIADSPWGSYTSENEFKGAHSLTLLEIE